MTKPIFTNKSIRLSHVRIFDLADELQILEQDLVELLYTIDQSRTYVALGHKSLLGFCMNRLRFSRTQSQRIVTLVRRYEPTAS